MRSRFLFPFFIIAVLSFQASSQRVLKNGIEGSPVLTWDDFKGPADNGSPYFAYTYWYVSYSYAAFQFKKDTVDWKVIITVELTNNSWKRKDKLSDSLLKHEQGHFDIGRICAKEAQRKVNASVFLKTSNYQEKLKAMIVEIVDRYRLMDLKYDEETRHGAIPKEQMKWNTFFRDELAKLP
jgi:hypothetical protein